MNRERITLKDIAARLGVSHTTVALALKNHPRISAERCAEVRRVAEQMGYVPDPFLSGLAAYRRSRSPARFQGLIAWINHWSQPERLRSYHEFEGYWQGAAAAAARFGYQLEEIQWPADCSARRFERILVTRGIRGLLIPPHKPTVDWGDFDWSRFSLIRFGMSVRRPDSNLVTSDQHRAVVMAVRQITERGYRRIGLVVDHDFEHSLGGNYFGGFCWAQRLLRLKPALPPYLMDGELRRADPGKGLRSFERWLNARRPDAILITDAAVPEMLKELGYRVPRDVALAGTSVRDLPVDAGIDQHSEDIGRIAMEMLVKQLQINEHGEPHAPCRILVESTWQDGRCLPLKT